MTSNGIKKMVIGIEGNTVNLSPMASLALNFSDTSLSATPSFKMRKRHLSMSNLTPSTPASSFSVDLDDGPLGTPRFSKGMQKISGGKGSLMRRLNSDPITSAVMDSKKNGNKENDRQILLSPLKRDAVTKPLSGSPLRPKVPFENHDGNSQDSGFAQDDTQNNFRFAEPNACGVKKVEASPQKIPDLGSPNCKLLSTTKYKSMSEGKVTSISFCSTESSDDGFMELVDLDKSFSDENNTALPVGMDTLLNSPLLALNDTIPVEEKNDCEDDDDSMNISSRLPLRRVNSLFENYNSPASSKVETVFKSDPEVMRDFSIKQQKKSAIEVLGDHPTVEMHRQMPNPFPTCLLKLEIAQKSDVRVGLFRDSLLSPSELSPFDKLPFKRPREIENNSVKRRKYASSGISEKCSSDNCDPRYKLQRSISDSAAFSLASAMHKSDLIADFSRPYALPVISGRHEDLKSISSETLADLINGNYSNTINSFRIIDCRYPYEYEGGHIKGSINLYTKEQVQQELLDCIPNPTNSKEGGATDRRNILIFHCEFSLERGPTLCRFLRRCDRNVSSYPCLQYPEMYLLHGGYESFFSSYKSLCEPCSYQPMVDPKHENDLKKFRIKSSSWSGDVKRSVDRTGLKRLGLF